MRLLRSAVVRLTVEDTADEASELTALMKVLVAVDLLPVRFSPSLPQPHLEQELFTYLFREDARSPLLLTLTELRRLASTVRDRLSVDTSRILNQLHQDFGLRQGRIRFDDVLTRLNQMITDLAAFSGMEMENMTRGHGWRFLDVGRRLERAINLTTLLGKSLAIGGPESAMLEPLLEIADSSMTYRRRYFARPHLPLVLDLLLADQTNARALAFQIEALSEHVRRLPRDPKAPSPTREEQLIARVSVSLRDVDMNLLAGRGLEGWTSGPGGFFDAVQDTLLALSDAITHFYFTHGEQRVS
jgi:uncharacterized alpha-E superfamily protein